MGFLSPKKGLDELEEENESARIQVSLAEKRALINEAKRRYGTDWKTKIPNLGGFMGGLNWSALKFRLR